MAFQTFGYGGVYRPTPPIPQLLVRPRKIPVGESSPPLPTNNVASRNGWPLAYLDAPKYIRFRWGFAPYEEPAVPQDTGLLSVAKFYGWPEPYFSAPHPWAQLDVRMPLASIGDPPIGFAGTSLPLTYYNAAYPQVPVQVAASIRTFPLREEIVVVPPAFLNPALVYGWPESYFAAPYPQAQLVSREPLAAVGDPPVGLQSPAGLPEAYYNAAYPQVPLQIAVGIRTFPLREVVIVEPPRLLNPALTSGWPGAYLATPQYVSYKWGFPPGDEAPPPQDTGLRNPALVYGWPSTYFGAPVPEILWTAEPAIGDAPALVPPLADWPGSFYAAPYPQAQIQAAAAFRKQRVDEPVVVIPAIMRNPALVYGLPGAYFNAPSVTLQKKVLAPVGSPAALPLPLASWPATYFITPFPQLQVRPKLPAGDAPLPVQGVKVRSLPYFGAEFPAVQHQMAQRKLPLPPMVVATTRRVFIIL